MRALGFPLAVALTMHFACVPTDDSEVVRGAVFAHVVSPPGETRDFQTQDGWRVRVARVIGTLGLLVEEPQYRIENKGPIRPGDCLANATGREAFGFVDLAVPFDFEQRGISPRDCKVRLAFVFSPVGDLLRRSPGVTDDDALRLRDRVGGGVQPERLPSIRYARIQGEATLGARRVDFDWWIARSVGALNGPKTSVEEGEVTVIVLAGDRLDVAFYFDARQIFRVNESPGAATRFGAFAELDEDRDGVISQNELEILWDELKDELPHYGSSVSGLSVHEFVALQLTAGWRASASP